jgi:CheY-like chemotaxis protein/HPt (histidine-containing phosphotransfer) domain-containing protein
MLDPGHFEDLLERLERDVLAIDRTGDTSIIHLLFRNVHNLKSSAAQAGLPALASDLHDLEEAMDRVRRGKAPWTTACYDQVTRMIDLVRSALHADPQGEAAPLPDGAMAADPRGEVAAPAAPGPWGAGLSPKEEAACSLAEAVGLGIYRIEKLFRRGLDEETFQALPILEDIGELGKLIAIHPPWAEYSRGPEEQVVQFLFASPKSAADLAEVFFDPLITLRGPRAGATFRRKAKLKILTIEDDPTTGLLMNHILKQHGDAIVCESGMQGLALHRESLESGDPFDLVILDLFLPDIHGDEVLKGIREAEFKRGIHAPDQRCVVIINTVSDDLDHLVTSLKQEPDGYLIKPIDIDLLIEKVNSLKAERVIQ